MRQELADNCYGEPSRMQVSVALQAWRHEEMQRARARRRRLDGVWAALPPGAQEAVIAFAERLAQ